MSNFFIKRPVFAWVIAIIIMLSGLLSISRLPVEQYPNIAPPSVAIRANFSGASSEVIENSVTQIIEQRLTGIDNLRYFTSNSSDGQATINIIFEPGTNPDIAQVQVQNKVQGAIALLPQEVQNQGVFVTKSNESFLLVAGFYSEDGSISQQEIADILSSDVKDQISRLNGVGNVTVFGDPHAIRIWLDPDKLLKYNLTAIDVKNAVSAQNIDVSAGQLGALPAVNNQQINATINVQSKLKNVEEFSNIILKVNVDSSQIRLRDVSRIELGSQGYSRIVRYKRKPATGIAISLASQANALKTSALVKEKISEIQKTLPSQIKVSYPYDTTPFVKLSIKNVVQTLFEAIILVFLVMLLFLQNFRATLIPTIAVPVVLLGTFTCLGIFGFSINVLTMFAIVLVIGLLVDDAIVVVENVERLIRDENMSPKEATIKSMSQISGALIAIALVLSSVFVPMAFFQGSAGAIYKQFSITIVSAMILSVFVALILSPSLCATILKPNDHNLEINFLKWFNVKFDFIRDKYQKLAEIFLFKPTRSILIYFSITIISIFTLIKLPTSFLPNEDQGIMFLIINTPSASTASRTLDSVKKIENHFLDNEKNNVEHLFTVTGYSFAGISQNTALGFVSLKDWSQRKRGDQSVMAISSRAMQEMSKIVDATAYAFFPPPIRELGNSSGFDLQIIDRGNLGHQSLIDARNQILGMSSQNPKLVGVRPNSLNDVSQYKIDIDNEKAAANLINISDIYRNLQISFGSDYVNDFIDRGKIKRVYIQSDAEYRMNPEDINKWYLRNQIGKMVPFSAFASGRWTIGSPKLERFNGYGSINIQGSVAPGISTGEAIKIIEEYAKKLPKGIDIAWSGLSYEEKLSSRQTPALYTISILVVFLCLAALYESWLIPFSVILTIPLGVSGAAIITKLFGLNNDIYFQIALLATIGLTSKNAILIVEFAKKMYQETNDLLGSTLIAAKIRFRPIIMTSFAFMLGVTPLALSSGAGSAAQKAIGIAVIGGMLTATSIAILFIPLFYVFIEKKFGNKYEK